MKHDGIRLDDALAVPERTPACPAALLAGLPETWVSVRAGCGV